MRKMNWYMISTISGKENVVVEALANRIIAEQVDGDFDPEATENGPFKIFQKPVLTPKELEKKREGKDYKIKWVNMYPGYIFIKMDMTDRAWFVIRNTQYVTGLIGSSGKGAKPTPVTEREIRKSLQREKMALEEFNQGKYFVTFKVGDVVEIIEGPYTGERGIVQKISDNSLNAVIEIESFGKKVPVSISCSSLQVDEL
ncbi:transcription termination/antitermination protein NusG [Mycoplasma anserisalpingitidis]|uniref:Transcription termination/antitermination protein NusG n=1 Tax=Mycoplasma anserisalpingitidis TaxID=519450 RepID=A0A5B8JXC8_9MOLU|nr:transcription termination/antitermination protein NusG [Mycoplasma anserisalpingitidis]QDY87011.1 transcription termination/antitermination protein NusG [Mycoplasma anserisalpingitidis]